MLPYHLNKPPHTIQLCGKQQFALAQALCADEQGCDARVVRRVNDCIRLIDAWDSGKHQPWRSSRMDRSGHLSVNLAKPNVAQTKSYEVPCEKAAETAC